MTRKQLLSTGVLDYIFESNKRWLKGKDLASSRIFIADTIVSWSKMIEKAPTGRSLSKEYFRELTNDLAILEKIKTHKQEIQPIKEIIAIKMEIGSRFIRLYRQKSYKDYIIDLFLVTNNDNLHGVKYKKRIEILSDLYLLIETPSIIYKGWKSRHPDYWEKRSDIVEKRLHRANVRFNGLIKTNEFKIIEKKFTKKMTNHINFLKSQGKEIDPALNSMANIKKFVRKKLYIKCIIDEPMKHIFRGGSQNTLKLKEIVEEVKTSYSPEKVEMTLQDKKFIQALGL